MRFRKFHAFFKNISLKIIEQKKLRRLKECGTAIVDGRELQIIDVEGDVLKLQDALGREEPLTIKKTDERIMVIKLHPAFT